MNKTFTPLASNKINANGITVERVSANIWLVNGTRIDVRKWDGFNFFAIRIAFNKYYIARNPRLHRSRIDQLYCTWHNQPGMIEQIENLQWNKQVWPATQAARKLFLASPNNLH